MEIRRRKLRGGGREGSSELPSSEARRKGLVMRTVVMMISSSVGGERSIWRSKITPAEKGPAMLRVR